MVDVVLKPEILDPQGQAIAGALARLGIHGVTDVRQGKHFELEVDDSVDDAALARMADTLLSNPVIENFTIHRLSESRRRLTWRAARSVACDVPARIGVVTFPGSLDDRDAARAVRAAGAEAVPLWHADPDLHGVDAVVLPGGFSYGDYLRCGAIARFAPVMRVGHRRQRTTACRSSASATASRSSARRTCCPAR